MAEDNVLIIKLRGQGFPVKDSGLEGNAADPFYEIRRSYDLGANPAMHYEGKQAKQYKALYTSEKVTQDLNPQWQPMAVDLRLLCGMDVQRKLLFDVFDWDRFSSPDFMSYVELSIQDLLDKRGGSAIALLPPGSETKHKQQVGELFVDSAVLAFPQVHVFANAHKKPTKGPDIHITNLTTIPLKVRLGTDYGLYGSAELGKPIGRAGDFGELVPNESQIFPRPNLRTETYLFVLSPNSTELVLAKHGLGTFVKGSKTTALSLNLDLAAPDSAIFEMAAATAVAPSDNDAPVPGGNVASEEGSAAPAAKSKGFQVTLSLKLRGNDLPIKDEGYLGGKSDPYFKIRPAFGPGYVSPNCDVNGRPLATRNYVGKHSDRPFLKSEVVKNELNPRWQTHLLDLTELCHLNGRGGLVDLSRKVLIDIWDQDMDADDFMCFTEVSLQDLVDAAESRAPLHLSPPPDRHKQSVGRLYVDKAVVGFPEVSVRDNRGPASPDGLRLTNATPVLLQVVLASSLDEYNSVAVGRTLKAVDYARTTMISAGADGTILRQAMTGSTAQLLILNQSNLVVGKKALPAGPGTRELSMDLEGGPYALSTGSVHDQLQSNYEEAVARIGKELAGDDVSLSDDDVRFFKEQKQRSEELALLLPVFGMQAEGDGLGLASFEAFLQRQAEAIQRELLGVDLLSGDGDVVGRVGRLLKKMHMVDEQCDPAMKMYGEMRETLAAQIDRLHDDALQAMDDQRFDSVVKGLSLLRAAQSSELTKHLADEEYIATKYSSLVREVKKGLEKLKSDLTALAARSCTEPAGFSEEEKQTIPAALAGLVQSEKLDWTPYIEAGVLSPLVQQGKQAVASHVDQLLTAGGAVLTGPADNKLGRSKLFVSEASFLCGLAGMEGKVSAYECYQDQVLEEFQQAQTAVEKVLREVAVFSGAGWSKPTPGGGHPLLSQLPKMVNDLVEAEWVERAGGSRYAKALEGVKSSMAQSVQVMFGQAKAAAATGHEDGVHKVLYVAEQIETLAGVGKKHPALFEEFKTESEDLAELLEAYAAKLDAQVKKVFPWHADESVDIVTLLSVDATQADRVLDGITALVAYVNRKGLSGMLDSVEALFAKCVERVLGAMKGEVDKLFQTEGDVDGIDTLRKCMRSAATIKDGHPSLYRLYTGPNFLDTARQKLVDKYTNLERDLKLNESKPKRTDELLQVVRVLCVLDDVIVDQGKKFTDLYQQYEESMKQRVGDVVQDIIGRIRESNFAAVDEMLDKENLKASVPWQVKAELSNQVELSIEAVSKKVRELPKELPSQTLDEIASELKTLSKAAALVRAGVVREDVQTEFDRLVGGAGGGRVRSQLLDKVKAAEQDVEQLLGSDQFGRATEVLRNLEQAWPVLETVLDDKVTQQPTVKDKVSDKLSSAVKAAMDKFRALDVEQYQFQPPADFFKMFEDMPQFKSDLDALWTALEQKVQQKMETSFLGVGSKDLAMLKLVIGSLPDKPGKAKLLSLVDEGSTSAQREMQKLFAAVDERNAEDIVSLSKKSTPSAQRQLWDALEERLDQLRRDFCKQLDKSPADFKFDRAFVKDWTFVVEIQKELPEAQALQYKIKKILEEAQESISNVENAAASALSCMIDGRSISAGDERFRDLDGTSEFLQRLVSLKCEHGSTSVGAAVLPAAFGDRCRNTLRDLVNDYKAGLKGLQQLLKTDPPERAFDINKIVASMQVLKARAGVYFDAREMLLRLDSVLGADSWQSLSLTSVSSKGGGEQAQDPTSWKEIADKVRRFVVEHFKPQPDMMVKIKISSDRVKFFQLLGKKAAAADHLGKVTDVVASDGDLDAIVSSDYQGKLQTAIKTVWGTLQLNVNALKAQPLDATKFSSPEYSNKQDNDFHSAKARFDDVNRLHGAVCLYKEHVAPNMKSRADSDAMDPDAVSEQLLQRVVSMAGQVEALQQDLDGVAGVLMCMHSQAEELLFQTDDCKRVVAGALEKFQTAEATKAMGISKLAVKLRHTRMRPAGEAVVRGYDAFQGYLTQVFNQKTQSQDIKYVLENIKDDKNRFDTNTTSSKYAEYDKEYKTRVDELLTGGLTETQLVGMIKQSVAKLNISHAPGCVAWTADMKRAIPKLVALVFAVWTLHHSKRFLQAMDSTDKKAFLFMPHPVQVVAIFSLLGMDSTGAGLQRSLVQVRTGEGKSAVLGVAASVFALFKCRVNCACYSEYLSQRDGASMEFLFKALGILEDVRYMTLSKVCEYEINKKVNIRERLEATIMGQAAGSAAAVSSTDGQWKPRVLLVDEVDVFFSKDFYGSAYVPACELRHQSISDLIREIFKAGLPLTLQTVKTWGVYSSVVNTLSGWGFLVDAAVSELLACMATFAEDVVENEYIVKDDKIGYKEQDSIAFNISYGFTTLLAYLKENQAGNISEHSLARNLKFLVRCGSFSYAKLPQDFDLVMGVTGTLETMSEEERRIVKDEYEIDKLVYMPSVYGNNQVETRRITAHKTKEEFVKTLVEEIETHRKDRAAIVFFDSSQELREFAKQEQFQHGDDANYLLEEIYPQEKDQIVKIRAATIDAITLATKPFGRGTDFQCMDDTVQQHGGIHIIQTFVAETLSEEIQIKGRTARQGEKGSWSMVLQQAEVTERFGIEASEMESVLSQGESEASRNQFWGLLNRQRLAVCEKELQEMVTQVKDNAKGHEEALSFTNSLLAGDVESVQRHLKAQLQAAAAPMAGKARILVLLDATGSMGRMMAAAKDTVSLMFDRAGEIIRENLGSESGQFEMQFAVYRNYSSGPAILLEASAWKSDPGGLRDFLSSTKCSGGQGNEAVEIALWHANQEEDVKRIVLIADAPGNTPDEVDKKRRGYGESRYQSTRFEQKTTAEAEVAKLKEKKIPVDVFHLVESSRLKEYYDWLAKEAGGTNKFLDVSSSAGRELFVGHITTAILREVGGAGMGDDLVGAYMRKFGGKMHS